MTRAVIVLAMLAALAGCGASRADRAGGSRPVRPVVLTFAAGNGGLPGFAAAVRRVSHGTMQIRFSRPGLKLPPDFESRIIADVRSGKADLGWVGSRAFPSFDALTAPLLIDSYAFEAEVLKSPVTEPMLRRLSSLGLIGIGVLPGPMRWVAGAHPLRGPADFAGLRIGTQRGNSAEATLRALGAQPVPMGPNQLVPGLDGVEQPALSLVGNRFYSEAPYVTGDVALWPRPPVVFAGPRARLTAAQIALLRRAAREAIGDELAHLRTDDHSAGESLCAVGATILAAGKRRRGALHAAVRPVYARLGRSHPALAEIERMRARFAGPPETLAFCAPRRPTPRVGAVSALDGLYHMTNTREQVAEVAPEDAVSENWGRWTLVLDRGLMAWTQENAQACTWGYGTFAVKDDVLEIRFRDGGGVAPNNATNKPGEFLAFHWRRYRDRLTLRGGAHAGNADSPAILDGTVFTRAGDYTGAADFPRRCPLPRGALGA